MGSCLVPAHAATAARELPSLDRIVRLLPSRAHFGPRHQAPVHRCRLGAAQRWSRAVVHLAGQQIRNCCGPRGANAICAVSAGKQQLSVLQLLSKGTEGVQERGHPFFGPCTPARKPSRFREMSLRKMRPPPQWVVYRKCALQNLQHEPPSCKCHAPLCGGNMSRAFQPNSDVGVVRKALERSLRTAPEIHGQTLLLPHRLE